MDPTDSLTEGFAVGDQNLPHDPKFQDTTSSSPHQVSADRDRLTDDDHKSLDAQTMKAFSAFRSLNEEPDFPSLLSNLTLGDKRLINFTRGEAEELLMKQPSINLVLQKAWKEGSFKEVRKLNVFWPVKTLKRHHRPSNKNVDLASAQSPPGVIITLEIYPSEPLLAEAAAQQLWVWRRQNPFMVVKTLTNIFQTGLLDRGELGELTGRQLLLDAYHRAVEMEQGDRSGEIPPNFSGGCRLVTFIQMLYTDEHADMVLNSMPDNTEGIPFREAFKEALVCFTHFGKMADDTGVTSTAAWAAFIRHMAIMCRNGQRTVDCIILVLLRDTQLCEHVMTGVLVRFKRQIQSGTVAEYSIDQAEFNFFPKSLVMELAVQPKAPEGAKTATISQPDRSLEKKKSDSPSRTPPPIEGGPDLASPSLSKIHTPQYGQRYPNKGVHARYNVFVYGCSPTVYRGIDAAHKASYALLLSSCDFLGGHPRKDAQTMQAVRRMKPFWNGGDDCYHWIEHDDILHGPDPPTVEFLVGPYAFPLA